MRAALLDALAPLVDADKLKDAARDFLAEADDGDSPDDGTPTNHFDVPLGERLIRIRLGSIASVKGETHDATLVLQTTFNRTRDVKTALSVACGSAAMPGADRPRLLRAVTNVFVAATRPRRVLCLALPASDLDAKLLAAIEGWGWRLIRISGDAAPSDTGGGLAFAP